jgi:uncharacterized protein (TIGR03435 family)
MRCLILATILITSAIALAAQSAAPAVTLEVASIKPAPPGSRGLVPGNWAPPTSPNARLRPMTLKTLVMYAFRNVNAPRSPVPEPLGGPAWIDQNLYELTLRFSALPTLVEARDLIRMLLEERFKLKWHREQRETPVYVLTRARPDGPLGAGLKPSALDCRAYSETLTRTGRGAVAKEESPECGMTTIGSATFVARGTGTIAELVRAMQNDRGIDRPIIDRTGLTGTFDVDLSWVSARSLIAAPADVLPLSTAVQEQLGLRLESRREPHDVIVIDAAELPAPD